MTEADWLKSDDPEPMLKALRDTASARKCRLFMVAFARQNWPSSLDDLVADALTAVESLADGTVSEGTVQGFHQKLEIACDTLERTGAFEEAEEKGEIPHSYWRMHVATWATQADALIAIGHVVWLACSFRVGYNSPHAARDPIGDWYEVMRKRQATLLRDIFGNPFRPVAFAPTWRTDTAVALARGMYESRDFGAMPILADAIQDAGCDSDDILTHCRDAHAPHVRGCWVVDLVLGKA